jgi:hypothetical protein
MVPDGSDGKSQLFVRQLRLDDFLHPIFDDSSNHAIPISRTGPAESFWKLRWRQMPDNFDKSARNSDRSWIKGDHIRWRRLRLLPDES